MSTQKIENEKKQEVEMGRYEKVALALDWISMVKNTEDYRRLTQTELINKALEDIETNVATRQKVEELREKAKKQSSESDHQTNAYEKRN
ncbi:MAG: hypothetical protein LBU55_02340 [Elusimicrobiota bacterium]|jgi:hypothetical protein|nr:hypothetical protein [Elusimicrobiota bacterium]